MLSGDLTVTCAAPAMNSSAVSALAWGTLCQDCVRHRRPSQRSRNGLLSGVASQFVQLGVGSGLWMSIRPAPQVVEYPVRGGGHRHAPRLAGSIILLILHPDSRPPGMGNF